ncbi:MAG: prepilin-type N-terminal cleavage/methylation domain-containing protein [Sedimentisphaerales bacterium]|nr:prepilin-type N-terminal cleavage/methylation domain-containing protein [Sedimentisphaerales bacterium]
MLPQANQTTKPGGFTLIELLVVIAILALLLVLLIPVLGTAREQAKVTVANAELYTIGLALESYGLENRGSFPPTYVSCMDPGHYYQMPDELVQSRYLPAKSQTFGAMSSPVADPFNPGHTYKYVAPGDLIMNLGQHPLQNRSLLWVPDGYPDAERTSGQFYRNPKDCPASWAIYSLGPRFDAENPDIVNLHYPLPRRTWYTPARRQGLLARIRLASGEHIGTFTTSKKR